MKGVFCRKGTVAGRKTVRIHGFVTLTPASFTYIQRCGPASGAFKAVAAINVFLSSSAAVFTRYNQRRAGPVISPMHLYPL